MSTENVLCDMEKGGIMIVRESKQSRKRCCLWVSVCAFILLGIATAVLMLLHFKIISQGVALNQIGQLEVIHRSSTVRPEAEALIQHSQVNMNSSSKPAAHLIANEKDGNLHWSADTDHAFLKNGMELKNNKLVIPSSGLYFVYTQVVFKGICFKLPKYLEHTVKRFSEEYPDDKPLLRVIKSTCSDSASKNVWYQPIYQGAVFSLSKNDELSTVTSPVSKVDTTAEHTYFGVFAL